MNIGIAWECVQYCSYSQPCISIKDMLVLVGILSIGYWLWYLVRVNWKK